jgi:NAD(P)-dependent dehydrogenase (short-subunit alcohol dehydrogenase family)
MTGAPRQKRNRPFPEKIELLLSFPLIPAARVGIAKGIVAAVLYLASDAAKFTTGTSLL